MKHIILCVIVVLAGCSDNKVSPEQKHIERKAAAQHRFEQWAYVAKEKQIAPGETVKLLIIPDPEGIDFLDTKCLIYTHQDYRQSNMICPNTDSMNLKEDQ